jgi:hypothetical protein
MKAKMHKKQGSLARLVQDMFETQDEEIQCEEAGVLIGRSADALLSDEDSQKQYPALWRHFHFCSNCAEEYALAMELARLEAAGQLEQPTLAPSPSGWILPAPVLAGRWFTAPLLAQARSAAGQPAAFERHLLLSEVVKTPWGLAGLEIVAQRESGSSDQIEIGVNVAFEQPVNESIRATLRYAGEAATSVLDEHGHARFTDIALNGLFDVSAKQARSNLCLFLSPAT